MMGVLGGTFDPIHFGHLRPALDSMQALALREVRFVPLNVAVHRSQPVASADHRLAMVRAAVDGQHGFSVDDRELLRPGGSYSYDTLSSLKRELGDDHPICLLTGEDAFRDFLTWYRPDGILDLAHVVVMRRPGAEVGWNPELRRWISSRTAVGASDLEETPAGRILFQQVTQLDISATAIRRLVSAGKSPRYLLPQAVLDIIELEHLYLESSGNRALSPHEFSPS